MSPDLAQRALGEGGQMSLLRTSGIDIFKLGGMAVFVPAVALPLIPCPLHPSLPRPPICSVGTLVAEDGAFALGTRRKAKLILHLTEPLPPANMVAVGNFKKQPRLQRVGHGSGRNGAFFSLPSKSSFSATSV